MIGNLQHTYRTVRSLTFLTDMLRKNCKVTCQKIVQVVESMWRSSINKRKFPETMKYTTLYKKNQLSNHHYGSISPFEESNSIVYVLRESLREYSIFPPLQISKKRKKVNKLERNRFYPLKEIGKQCTAHDKLIDDTNIYILFSRNTKDVIRNKHLTNKV